MKTIYLIIIFLAIIGGVIWLAKPGSSGQGLPKKDNGAIALATSKGSLEAGENFFDFGTISMAKGDVSHVFKVKNIGTEPVTIGKMYSSCMCTTAFLTIGDKKFGPYGMPGHGFIPSINEVVAPGEEVAVEAVFDPQAHGPAGVGRIQRKITIENNGVEVFELGFEANVTP